MCMGKFAPVVIVVIAIFSATSLCITETLIVPVLNASQQPLYVIPVLTTMKFSTC